MALAPGVCYPSDNYDYAISGYTGHIPAIRDQVGLTHNRAVTRVFEPAADDTSSPVPPPWTGPSAHRPAWTRENDLPAGETERPAWLGRLFDGGVDEFGRITDYLHGYTGYKPDVLDVFGKQYRYPCRPEWRYYPRPRHVAKDVESCIRRALSNDVKRIVLKPPPCDAPEPVKAQEARKGCQSIPHQSQYVSPYELPGDHPDKYFTLGYTGAVPDSHEFVGVAYPEMTRQAMNKFGSIKDRAAGGTERYVMECSGQNTPRLPRLVSDGAQSRHAHTQRCCKPRVYGQNWDKVVYPVDTGLVPHYAGHVPGHRWRSGETYGMITRDCKADLRKVMDKLGKCNETCN